MSRQTGWETNYSEGDTNTKHLIDHQDFLSSKVNFVWFRKNYLRRKCFSFVWERRRCKLKPSENWLMTKIFNKKKILQTKKNIYILLMDYQYRHITPSGCSQCFSVLLRNDDKKDPYHDISKYRTVDSLSSQHLSPPNTDSCDWGRVRSWGWVVGGSWSN